MVFGEEWTLKDLGCIAPLIGWNDVVVYVKKTRRYYMEIDVERMMVCAAISEFDIDPDTKKMIASYYFGSARHHGSIVEKGFRFSVSIYGMPM